MEGHRRQTVLSWLFMGALIGLSLLAGFLQYRWIGQVSEAERDRLKAGLQASLNRLSQEFNADITIAVTAILPERWASNGMPPADEFASRYFQWRESSRRGRLFRGVWLGIPDGLAAPESKHLELRHLNIDSGEFENAAWPEDWTKLRDRLSSRIPGGPGRRPFPGPVTDEYADVMEIPIFRPAPPFEFERRPVIERRMEQGWLILQLDLDYIRASMIPELMNRYLGGQGGAGEYQVEITMRDDPSSVIFQTAGIAAKSDASVPLFELRMDMLQRRTGAFGRRGPRAGPGPRGRGPEMGMPPGRGRWTMYVRHRSGSLESLVAQARTRNLAITAGILVLLLAAAGALVRFTRRAQKLAELQMEFVAGVSHELRTPLSVMRTAGHNLRGRMSADAARVQQYGALIEEQSQRLTGIVEQVLNFSNIRAGRVIGPRQPVAVPGFLDAALESDRQIIAESGCRVEKRIEPELPLIRGDATALSHAFRNLISNAAKYGHSGGYIGIFARPAERNGRPAVEIRVCDHGPGIPAGELEYIFEPFYRGRRAITDQVHGTGLGLSLAKRIVEAHHGTLTVHTERQQGTEFRVLLPALAAQEVDEFSHSADRRRARARADALGSADDGGI